VKIKTTLMILGSLAALPLFGGRASDSYTIEAEGLLPQTSFAAGSFVLNGTFAGLSGSSAGSYTLLAGINPGSNTLIALPSIVDQPEAADLLEGEALSLAVSLAGPGPFTYQWLKDGEAITDAVLNPFELIGVINDDEGDYEVVVSNPFGEVSSLTASVSVLAKPVLIDELEDIEGNYGGTASFAVNAEVEGTAAYQWSKDGVEIAGATGTVLSLTDLGFDDIGTYSIEISNEAGSLTASADLTLAGAGPTDVPRALVGSALLEVGEGETSYESDWFGEFTVRDDFEFGWVYTMPLGLTYFTSISTSEAATIYPLLIGGILYTNSNLYPSYAYSYRDASWVYFPEGNDASTGRIWVYVYAESTWVQFPLNDQ
jgi:hypothetical protein